MTDMRIFFLLLVAFLALPLGAQQKPAAPPVARKGQAAAPAASMKSQPAPAIALRGGKLLTITKGVIENGVVVMENGKITAVGAVGAVAIPKNAKLIDVTGMTVYPGLIDSQTRLGLTEISAVPMSNDLVEPSDAIMPHMHVYDAFHAETELIPVTRMNGITNAIVAPTARDTMSGQMALIQLDGKDAEEMMMVKDIALSMNFTGAQRRNESFDSAKFPMTRMGMAAQLRQAFVDAQDYAQKWADYEKKAAEPQSAAVSDKEKTKERATPPKRDLKLEALLPFLQGKKPVMLAAEEASDVIVATRLAKEFNLKVILAGVIYSQAILDQVAASKLPVVVGDIYSTPKNNDRYDAQFRLPAELAKRGVKIAFASYDSHQARNLPYAAGYAIAFGLPYEEALKALTINPAEIWGVADQLGSLDVGKTANVVVADGDPLELRTDVKRVFISGHEVPMESRQTQLRDAYMKR
jgi:imidazolonepropionase-like amidohydrolase